MTQAQFVGTPEQRARLMQKLEKIALVAAFVFYAVVVVGLLTIAGWATKRLGLRFMASQLLRTVMLGALVRYQPYATRVRFVCSSIARSVTLRTARFFIFTKAALKKDSMVSFRFI